MSFRNWTKTALFRTPTTILGATLLYSLVNGETMLSKRFTSNEAKTGFILLNYLTVYAALTAFPFTFVPSFLAPALVSSFTQEIPLQKIKSNKTEN